MKDRQKRMHVHECAFLLRLAILLAAKSNKVELLVVFEVYAITHVGALHTCTDNRQRRRCSNLLVGGESELLPWCM